MTKQEDRRIRETERLVGSMNDMISRLCEATAGCRDDMHEPDNNGVTAWVVGTGLDNTHGDNIDLEFIRDNIQELVVVIAKNHVHKYYFNLASLIALAKIADPRKFLQPEPVPVTVTEKPAPSIHDGMVAKLKESDAVYGPGVSMTNQHLNNAGERARNYMARIMPTWWEDIKDVAETGDILLPALRSPSGAFYAGMVTALVNSDKIKADDFPIDPLG